MNRFALIVCFLLLFGCSTLKDALHKDYTPVNNPDIKDRPVFYSMPQTGEYIDDLGSIYSTSKGSIEMTCEALADIAIDKLVDEAKKKGGHAALVVSFSECVSNKRSGRSVSVDGMALSNIKLQPPKVAKISEVFLSHKSDMFNKYELTIIELTAEKISFQYSEYTYSSNAWAWLIKQGFNKTFTYSTKETIRFKGYEFEPISVTNGQFTYKRTK